MATLSVLVHLTPTRFTTGFYTVDGDLLTMTNHEGQPVEPPVTAHLKPGDNALAIASVLTKEIRNRMVNPFWDDLNMPESGVA